METKEATPRGVLAADISRQAVQILRDYTGRGPTKARTLITDELTAIIVADALTKGEQRLVELGKGDHVIRTRREYQGAMQEELVGLVESVTGRKVIAFLSDNHFDPDIGIEAFVMERPNGKPDSEPEAASEPEA